jgi:tRNA(Ile)-lysidine synthase
MLVDLVRKTIHTFRLLKKNDTVLIAVSGGPDSMALASLLLALRKELCLKLHAAHLDHGLRRDSARDREFVERWASRMGLPCTAERIGVKLRAVRGSLEEAARTCRMEFLFRAARQAGAGIIALGHNRDDQAETVLMRLLRGTGLYGLGAIQMKRKIGERILIRPLLDVSRKEITAYLKRAKIPFRVDSSNAKEEYTRNRIRNSLLPLLEKKYNPNIRGVLAVTAETAASDYDYLGLQAERAFKNMGGVIRLDRLAELHPALRRIIFRIAIARLQGNTRRITFKHILELEDLVSNRPSGSIVDLPHGVSAVKKRNSVKFYLRRE